MERSSPTPEGCDRADPSTAVGVQRVETALEEFEARGFVIVPASDHMVLDSIRVTIRDAAAEILGFAAGRSVGDDLDRLHEHLSSSSDAASFRNALTRTTSERLDAGPEVFSVLEPHLSQLVGVDVLAQRVPNFVFQPPGDPMPTELHRDAPANSPYEVVVWLPLVDCAGTKSMYLLDKDKSQQVLAFHRAHPDDSVGFQHLLDENAEFMTVPYGSALLFWPGLFHGSRVNREQGSRLSLNIRYKNLFAPLGMKDPFRYFAVMRTSPLTRLGLAFERAEGPWPSGM